MTGTITRLVDSRQVGCISAADGREYTFTAGALRGVAFFQLSLGTAVTFTPRQSANEWRAESVQVGR